MLFALLTTHLTIREYTWLSRWMIPSPIVTNREDHVLKMILIQRWYCFAYKYCCEGHVCQCCDDTWHLVLLYNCITLSHVLLVQVTHLVQSAREARQFVGDWLKMLDVIGDAEDFNYLDLSTAGDAYWELNTRKCKIKF